CIFNSYSANHQHSQATLNLSTIQSICTCCLNVEINDAYVEIILLKSCNQYKLIIILIFATMYFICKTALLIALGNNFALLEKLSMLPDLVLIYVFNNVDGVLARFCSILLNDHQLCMLGEYIM